MGCLATGAPRWEALTWLSLGRALKSSQHSLCSVMIVDTPGFQNPEQGGSARGASFEELCHNYAQDRLQRLFHERTFVQELERYKEVVLDLAPAASHPQARLALAHSESGGICGCSGFPAGCSLPGSLL